MQGLFDAAKIRQFSFEGRTEGKGKDGPLISNTLAFSLFATDAGSSFNPPSPLAVAVFFPSPPSLAGFSLFTLSTASIFPFKPIGVSPSGAFPSLKGVLNALTPVLGPTPPGGARVA